MNDNKKTQEQLMRELHESGIEYEKAKKDFKLANYEWWNRLSESERENAFFAVTSRIFEAEVEQRRSYRGALYDVFKFQPGMYALGMDSGYFAIHNMLFDAIELESMKNVNRFEVIDENGRSYVKYLNEDEGISYSLQDDNKTLKVFIDKDTWRSEL